MVTLPFANRLEAGRLLAEELSRLSLPADSVVLGLARGGVPLASRVAAQLNLRLDVIVARKIGVPWQPELAMGALAGSVCVLDKALIRQLRISDEEVREVTSKEQAEMHRREQAYRGGKPALDVRGKTVVLVDDGLATGSTMAAAARYLRTLDVAKVIVASPVGSETACQYLRSEADQVVCLAIPDVFYAVGQWYRDFSEVSDSEVERLLARTQRGQVAPAA